MDVVVLAPVAQGTWWQQRIENLGDDWRCLPFTRAEQAVMHLRRWYVQALVLLPGPESGLLLSFLAAHAPLSPPWLLGCGVSAPDGAATCPEALPALLAARRREGALPALAAHHLPAARAMAASLLRQLGASPRLGAWVFLPEMIAATVVHPPLLDDLRHGLYPLLARRTGLTPAAVERRLRLLVESTWDRGDIGAIERFFGHTVDPERGKPTNREFLCGVQGWVARGMARML